MDQTSTTTVQAPPQTVLGILRRLGPGLIIAGSIVGSGELIATTKTGAQAGFWLLWLIIIGCVIKLFAQVEFGRYAISSGKTTMAALNEVPGPRWGVNWLIWYWLVMFIVSLAQLGAIVGGVGQALAMNTPIDGSFNQLLDKQDQWDQEAKPIAAELREDGTSEEDIQSELDRRIGRPRPGWHTPGFFWTDDITWASIATVVTIVVLVMGRYGLIQSFSMVMVAAFTLVTIFNVLALQTSPDWAMHWSDLKDGLSFRLPPVVEGLTKSPRATALATLGLIGVGANELIAYPYWCLEKGYGRFTGPRDESADWVYRAQGWMRVMRWDAVVSMLIYTFATVAFYILGATVLHRQGLDPEGSQMIQVLSQMYVEVFGSWAKWVFLFGAFAVLYSTFFVGNAGHTRVAADAMRLYRIARPTEQSRLAWIRVFCVLLPSVGLAFYIFMRHPTQLILASGAMQGIMLPMLAGATLYFRYRRCDARIAPGKAWDLCLWISALGLLLGGGWTVLIKLFPALEQW